MKSKLQGRSPRPWVKLWKEEAGAFAQLPFIARSVAAEVLKFLDDDGRMYVGTKHPVDALAFCAGADRNDRRVMRPAVEHLLRVGYLRVADGWLEAPSYRARQYGDATNGPLTDHLPTTLEPLADHSETTNGPLTDLGGVAKSPETRDPKKQEKRREEERRGEEEKKREALAPEALSLVSEVPDFVLEPTSSEVTGIRAAPAAKSDVAKSIEALESRYPAELVAAARAACARHRKSGVMADSLWHGTLVKLDAYEAGRVVDAMRKFTDRYATGEWDERYLLGIVRNAREERTSGWRPPISQSEYSESGTTPDELKSLFGEITDEDRARVERIGNRRAHG